MFNEKLQPMYQGRVLMNESALNDPVLIAVLDEMSEWGVDHIGGVDFDDPEVNVGMMNAYFA